MCVLKIKIIQSHIAKKVKSVNDSRFRGKRGKNQDCTVRADPIAANNIALKIGAIQTISNEMANLGKSQPIYPHSRKIIPSTIPVSTPNHVAIRMTLALRLMACPEHTSFMRTFIVWPVIFYPMTMRLYG